MYNKLYLQILQDLFSLQAKNTSKKKNNACNAYSTNHVYQGQSEVCPFLMKGAIILLFFYLTLKLTLDCEVDLCHFRTSSRPNCEMKLNLFKSELKLNIIPYL